MITAVKKGGLGAIIIAIVLVISTTFIPFFESFHLTMKPIFSYTWIDRVVFVVIVLIQSIWFQRVIHNARFFERSSVWPWISFMVLIGLTPGQFLSIEALITNFIWLIFYQKLFYHKDRELANYHIFMDAGVLLSIGFLFFPKFIYFLPFVLILLNQFAVTDLNRFYLVVFSFLMVAISAIAIGYMFVSKTWALGFMEELVPRIDFKFLQEPKLLYTYLTVLILPILLTPVIFNRLGYMQTQNRTVINMLYLQIAFTLIVAILSGTRAEDTLVMLALPLAFLVSFGSYHLKHRWLTNLFVLFLLFALVLIQWTYMRQALTIGY